MNFKNLLCFAVFVTDFVVFVFFSLSELRVAGTTSTGHFFAMLEDEGTLPDFYETHPNEWNEVKTRPLAELLPKLLELITYAFEKKHVQLHERNVGVVEVGSSHVLKVNEAVYNGLLLSPKQVHSLIASIYEKKMIANSIAAANDTDTVQHAVFSEFLSSYFDLQFGSVLAENQLSQFKGSVLALLSNEDTATWRLRWFSIFVGWDGPWEREIENHYLPFRKEAVEVWLKVLSQLIPMSSVEEKLSSVPCQVTLENTLHVLGFVAGVNEADIVFNDADWRNSSSFDQLAKDLSRLDQHLPGKGAEIDVDQMMNLVMREWYACTVGVDETESLQ